MADRLQFLSLLAEATSSNGVDRRVAQRELRRGDPERRAEAMDLLFTRLRRLNVAENSVFAIWIGSFAIEFVYCAIRGVHPGPWLPCWLSGSVPVVVAIAIGLGPIQMRTREAIAEVARPQDVSRLVDLLPESHGKSARGRGFRVLASAAANGLRQMTPPDRDLFDPCLQVRISRRIVAFYPLLQHYPGMLDLTRATLDAMTTFGASPKALKILARLHTRRAHFEPQREIAEKLRRLAS